MSTLESTVTPDAWDAIAPRYDQHVTPATNFEVAETALDRVDVGPHTDLLGPRGAARALGGGGAE